MAGLAGAFDPAMVRASMNRQLVPGRVVYLEIAFPEVTKNKYLVSVGADGEELFCIINSETSAFVLARPHLKRCQVTIDQAQHAFLQRDSVIACEKVHRFPRDRVLTELVGDPSRLKGMIAIDVRDSMQAAVKAAITLDVRLQTIIILALDSIV